MHFNIQGKRVEVSVKKVLSHNIALEFAEFRGKLILRRQQNMEDPPLVQFDIIIWKLKLMVHLNSVFSNLSTYPKLLLKILVRFISIKFTIFGNNILMAA